MKLLCIQLFVLVCLYCFPAAAQESNPSTTTSAPVAATDSVTMAELQARVIQLETRGKKWDNILAHLPRISGYMQLGYDGGTDVSSFCIKSVRLSLAGDIAPKIDYYLQLELASPKIVDAFMRYRPFDELNIQLGGFKLPFSIENTEYHPLNCEFISLPIALTRLVGFNDLCGLDGTGRDLGAMLYGSFFKKEGYNILSYNLGIFNGEGVQIHDANKSKDIAARLMVRPVRGLLISGSYYRGEYGREYITRERYSVGACYDYGRFIVRSEYFGGTTDAIDSEGWYALGGFRATKSLLVAARYDTFTEDTEENYTGINDTRRTDYTAGLTWQPFKYLRCQLNYVYQDYSASEIKNRHVVQLLFTGIF